MITHRIGSWVGNNVSKQRTAAIFQVTELFLYHSSRSRCNFFTLMMEAERSPYNLVINLRFHTVSKPTSPSPTLRCLLLQVLPLY